MLNSKRLSRYVAHARLAKREKLFFQMAIKKGDLTRAEITGAPSAARLVKQEIISEDDEPPTTSTANRYSERLSLHQRRRAGGVYFGGGGKTKNV